MSEQLAMTDFKKKYLFWRSLEKAVATSNIAEVSTQMKFLEQWKSKGRSVGIVDEDLVGLRLRQLRPEIGESFNVVNNMPKHNQQRAVQGSVFLDTLDHVIASTRRIESSTYDGSSYVERVIK